MIFTVEYFSEVYNISIKTVYPYEKDMKKIT